ncbi:DUF898 family protein [Devosia submarina]|uniref:DUF898 family protein n=1 Tax=Devosia submarina TaxID=1173082 RepID=UPI000D3BEDB0|nr:DUF898 family protein [Devosia submarina]
MVETKANAAVVFTGSQRELAGILLRGYALLVPTIGLYRFWLTSWKRRFYWSHTSIGGDRLEYTGDASQLMLGFLLALAVFVPLYGIFFYLSTLSSEAALIGYGAIGIFVWFLSGYAIYRARDFRLSRTLWRGIRFDQGGSAWGYAWRRFGWSVLMIMTGGLVYPFMAANLWRYRYCNTWYGDRQFGFTGNWRQIAWPYYLSYMAVLIITVLSIWNGAGSGIFPFGLASFNPSALPPLATGAAFCALWVLFYQSREISRMFSAVRLGSAELTVHIRARSLLWIYGQFALALLGTFVLLLVGGAIVLGSLAADAFADNHFDAQIFLGYLQSSIATVIAFVLGYLLLLGAFTATKELFIGYGFWRLVAQGADISGLQSLENVQARAEDKALLGEGLADALNVGAY